MTGLTRPISGTELMERLESAILSGEWAPGEQLPSERQLAERFAVSRPVVREALRSLRERGLIVAVAGRGSFVRESRPTEGGATVELLARRGQVTARHLVVARRMLECEAAHLAALHHGPEDARRMKTTLTAFDSTDDLGMCAELDVAFHESIAIASANPVIQIMFGSIRTLTHALVLRSLSDRQVRKAGAPYHQVIMEAVLARDPEAAREGMATHLGLAEEFYGTDLDHPLADVLRRRADYEPRVAQLLREVSSALVQEGTVSNRLEPGADREGTPGGRSGGDE